jgi:hypothetical protein
MFQSHNGKRRDGGGMGNPFTPPSPARVVELQRMLEHNINVYDDARSKRLLAESKAPGWKPSHQWEIDVQKS